MQPPETAGRPERHAPDRSRSEHDTERPPSERDTERSPSERDTERPPSERDTERSPSERQRDEEALRHAKTLLREAVRTRRAARPETTRARDDHARTLRTLDFLGDVDALRVALYLSVDAEPSTLELVGALAARGARVLLPVLRKEPDWAWYSGPDALESGWRGIPQPTGPRLGGEGLVKADVVLCSGLAATVRGDRLGVGGGWYDRARAYAPDLPTAVLLNDDEVLGVVPMEAHDRPVDVIVTPTRTIGCGSAG